MYLLPWVHQPLLTSKVNTVPPPGGVMDANSVPDSYPVNRDQDDEDPEKESRIATRRKRIMQKIEGDRRAALGEKMEEKEEKPVDEEKSRISYKQTKESEKRLQKLITDGKILVTNVKVAGDSNEVTRKQDEEEARRARYERLEAEVTAGSERFDEIMKKWSDGKDKRVPQELQSLIEQQSESCSGMVSEKDKLINELQQELMAKDDQYVKYLKKQACDIDLILERMESQEKMLQRGYQEELVEIEKSFEKERRELIEAYKADWEKIMKERAEKEKDFLEEKERRIERHDADIQYLRVQNAEAFNHIKIKLETDIQALQQQIQQMKATFQLNAEKLEYNFQVLKKRDEENTVTISQQKRRITRLQDTQNNMRIKLKKQEKACKAEMQLLVDEYRKNTEQYRELQKKVKHFQQTDSKRFFDVWKMNEARARELAQEVVVADMLIHKQQLGLEYTPPSPVESPLNTALPEKPNEKDTSRATQYASQVVAEVANESTTATTTSETLLPPRSATLVQHYPLVIIKQVLDLLCKECEFLMEDKLLRLLAPLEPEEQMMMKLDSIFKAIGVENEVDIHQLVKYFVTDAKEPLDSDKTGSASEENNSKAASAEVRTRLIHPNAVLGRLRAFVDSRQGGGESPLLAKGGITGLQGQAYKELLEGSFWKQIANLPHEVHEKIWDALTDGLDAYHSNLKGRANLLDETDSVRHQNTELSILLQQYSRAHVNMELVAPPTMQLHKQSVV